MIALGFAGRLDEARRAGKDWTSRAEPDLRVWKATSPPGSIAGPSDIVTTLESFPSLKIFEDPEAIFQEGWFFCDVGDYARGLEYCRRHRHADISPPPRWPDPQFDALRDDPAFQKLVADAEAGRQRAHEAFREAGGERLLAR